VRTSWKEGPPGVKSNGDAGDGGTEPLVRGRFCQEWLELVDAEPEPWRGRFMALLSSQMKETILGASRVSWLPLELHVTLSNLTEEALGETRAHAYYRRAFAAALRGPFLGPLVRTGARVIGLSPATFVRWAGRAYEAGFRNAGRIDGEVLGRGKARLVYSQLPAICTASTPWLTSAQGSTYGAYDALGVDGVVRLDLTGRAQGRLIVTLEWNETGS
jgi:hypothetical protein